MDDFRKWAHEVADWMADYIENVGELPIVPDAAPGHVAAQIAPHPPQDGEDFEAIFRDFREIIVPGMTHWNHPGWFAYFPANASPPSVLAEMLVTVMGAQCMSWQTSPAATELEQVMMRWLAELLGLPETFHGVIQDTASTATFVALLCARERASGGRVGEHGGASDMTVYTSAEAHSSVAKGVKLSGMGLDGLRLIDVDPQTFAMDPERLREAIEADVAAGKTPVCVVATVGTTSSTAVDPVAEIARIAAEYGVWLHVDAAYAGTAALLPEKRWIMDGVELADSFGFNPHKWMFTNFDCSAFWVRDPDALLQTFSTSPEYLRTARDEEVANFRDWGIQLGRRFRALKLWFVMRSYGARGLQAEIRKHIAWAEELAAWVDEDAQFRRVAPAEFGLVCFRWEPEEIDDDAQLDSLNEALLTRVTSSEDVYLTHTRLGDKFVLRACVGQWQTSEADLARLRATLLLARDELRVQHGLR